ncbi:MAG: hypothetical protein JWN98_1461 [Abditibacteriota bacterium]|nr:hypothetical protein [Abditibacteriota bacterium]
MINRFSLIFGTVLCGSGVALYAKPPAKPRYVPIVPQSAEKKAVQSHAESTSTRGARPSKTGGKILVKAGKKPSDYPTLERDVLPVIKEFCIDCHSGEDASADIVLDKYKTAGSILKDGALWERVAQNVDSSHMPPLKSPQPTRKQRDGMVQWIESSLSQAFCDLDDPGRVTLRRLNREEYNNTIRDLLGVDFKPAADFPSDDVGYGFDNIGDVLSISPLLMEKYLNAAEKIAGQALFAPEANIRLLKFSSVKFLPNKVAGYSEDGARLLGSTADVGIEREFLEGEYHVKVRAGAQQAGPDPARMALKLNGKELRVFDVSATEVTSGTYEYRLTLPAGKHRISMAFLNDFYDESLPEGKRDRNLLIDSLEMEGPRQTAAKLSPAHLKIMPRPVTNAMAPSERARYAREIMTKLARRAYRRPVSKAEVERLARYVDMAQKEGDSFERGLQVAVSAMLVSPHFLFRVELDADPKNPRVTHEINDFELASRLSYFLWSSMPDDSLLWWAEKGRLSEPKFLLQQVQRMLKDPRASSLANNFAMQWLELRRLNDSAPDPEMFPEFTPELRTAMQTETAMFCAEIIRSDRSILDFLDARFTYLNGPLAKHYGIKNVQGLKFQRVILSGSQALQRGGILSHASILTATSNPTRTSPVKRGKWVLEQILGMPPPPPPPDVPELKEDKAAHKATTMRKQLEQHRKDPNCASCHARMDPLGFGLENYDATGKWRTTEGKLPLDSTGELTTGEKFKGPSQLRTILKGRKSQFARCLSDKMLTFAIGRGLERADKCFVDDVTARVAKNNYRFSSMVLAIVQSEPFLKRRGDEKQKTPVKKK